MELLFYEYLKTKEKELESQIAYSKSIEDIKNNNDVSIKMRKLEKEVFGKERQYKTKYDKEYNLKIDNTTKKYKSRNYIRFI